MFFKRRPGTGPLLVPGLILISTVALLPAQRAGTITGRVLIEQTGAPIHNAEVLLVQLNQVAETTADGTYTFLDVPPGVYDLVAYVGSLNSLTELIRVRPGCSDLRMAQTRNGAPLARRHVAQWQIVPRRAAPVTR